MFKLLIIKRTIEDIILLPFIFAGRLIAYLKPQKEEFRIYFFFSFYHIGGAEKVHAQIAQACGGADCIIYFTRKSHNNLFLQEFEKSKCVIKDISYYTDNKWLYFINFMFRGIITGYINGQLNTPFVFNGQCNFGYKISPWIKKRIPQFELIHSLNSFSYIRIPFISFITTTVMISRKKIEEHRRLYEKYKIPALYAERIVYISNAIPLEENDNTKEDQFTVLYSGRGGEEKRLPLIAQIASLAHKDHPDIQFAFMGDVSNVIQQENYPFIKFYGAVSDQKEINRIYANAKILLLTSSTEGFPMVVIEGMNAGCAIIATPVGDIPLHVQNEKNGYLFSTVENETKIIEEGYHYIVRLKQNPDLLGRISANNRIYAQSEFSIERFNTSYRELFETTKTSI